MTLAKKTTYVAEGPSFFTSFLHGCPITEKILGSHSSGVQSFEDALAEVLVCHLLDTAGDSQLDDMGDLVGELRLGRADEDYRGAIKLRIRINRSNGTAEEILGIIDLLVAGVDFTYTEMPLAYFRVEAYDISTPVAIALLRNVGKAKPVGIRGELMFSKDDITNGDYFRWDHTTPTGNAVGLCHIGDEATKGLAFSVQAFSATR